MVRSLVFRVAAALALLPAGFAAPAAAVAHGTAHHRLHHEASEAGHQPATGWTAADHGHGDDHLHQRLANAVRTDNADAQLFALLPVRGSAAAPLPDVIASRGIDGPAAPFSSPGTGPPPRLRAPPLA